MKGTTQMKIPPVKREYGGGSINATFAACANTGDTVRNQPKSRSERFDYRPLDLPHRFIALFVPSVSVNTKVFEVSVQGTKYKSFTRRDDPNHWFVPHFPLIDITRRTLHY